MTRGDEFQEPGGVHLRTCPSAQGSEVREAGEQVDLCDAPRGLAHACSGIEQVAAQLGEDAALDLAGSLLRRQDLGLVLLELGRGEAFGVDEGLLALVVGGDGLGVGLGDLDVVAEDVVEADFERADAGALALAFFDRGERLTAAAAELA